MENVNGMLTLVNDLTGRSSTNTPAVPTQHPAGSRPWQRCRKPVETSRLRDGLLVRANLKAPAIDQENLERASFPDIATNVRLVFVAGIPSALNNEYLRVVGTIARLCSKKELVEKLLIASTPTGFIEILCSGESAL